MSEPLLDEILAIQDQINEKMANMVHEAIATLTEKGVQLDEVDTHTPDYDGALTYVRVNGVPVFRVCAIFFQDRVSVAASWVPEGADSLDTDDGEPEPEQGLDLAFAN